MEIPIKQRQRHQIKPENPWDYNLLSVEEINASSLSSKDSAEPANFIQMCNRKMLTLLVNIADGEHSALIEFYDYTSPLVYNLSRRILYNRGHYPGRCAMADEVMTSVFLQVWAQAGNYDDSHETPLTWLLRITHQQIIERLGTITVEKNNDKDFKASSLNAEKKNGADDIFKQCRPAVLAAMSKLTNKQRLLIETVFFEGVGIPEIAKRFQLSLEEVRAGICEGMMVLRQQLSAKQSSFDNE